MESCCREKWNTVLSQLKRGRKDYRPDQSLSDRVSGAHLLLSTLLLFEINYFIEGKKKVQEIRVEIFIARQEAEAEEADLPSRKSPLIFSHDS